MKRKTTKEVLAESFMELSQTKDIRKITIQEIVDNCQLSPATFYRYFTDKYDLIAWEYDRNFDKRFHAVDGRTYTWSDYTYETVQYSWDNRRYLQNLLNNTRGNQSYIRHVTEHTLDNYIGYITKKFGDDVMTDDLKLCLRHFIYGSIQLVCAWITGEFETTPEHLTGIIRGCVADPLKPFMQ